MTPSQIRRKGKQAFDPNTLPSDICPYKHDTWNYHDWMDGWQEEAQQYKNKQQEAEKNKVTFKKISLFCPWFENKQCIAIKKKCSEENCGIIYWNINPLN